MNKEELDYLTGKIAAPKWLLQKPARFYAYLGRQQILTSSAIVNSSTRQDSLVTTHGDYFFMAEGIQSSFQSAPEDRAGAFFYQIQDSSRAEPWSSKPIFAESVAGLGFMQRQFKTPQFLTPGTTLTVDGFTNPLIYGREIKNVTRTEAEFLMRRMYYDYVFELDPFGADDNETRILNTLNDSDFYCHALLSYQVFLEAARATSVQIKVNIFNQSTGEYLTNRPANLVNICGTTRDIAKESAPFSTSQNAYPLGYPLAWKIPRNSSVAMEATNVGPGDLTDKLQIVFTGCRTFDTFKGRI